MRLIAMITRKASIERYLTALGEPTDPPSLTRPGPPYWKSRVLRRLAAGDLDDGEHFPESVNV